MFQKGCSEVHNVFSDVLGSQTSTIQQSDKEAKDLKLLSVICIQTSHYVCFTRSVTQNRWIFFDSMADRVRKSNKVYTVIYIIL